MDGDRERWNAKWSERAGELETQSPFLGEHAIHLPSRGKALDIAGGAGRNAIWLARRGLDVTVVDVSDVALDRVERRVRDGGLGKHIRLVRHDLDEELPFAPVFDLVVVVNYLNRARRNAFVGLLHDSGVVVAVQPTVQNLERNASPSRAYLVELGEMESWARELGLDVLAVREGWTDEGRHEAAVIARRTPTIDERDVEPDTAPHEGPYR